MHTQKALFLYFQFPKVKQSHPQSEIILKQNSLYFQGCLGANSYGDPSTWKHAERQTEIKRKVKDRYKKGGGEQLGCDRHTGDLWLNLQQQFNP